MLSSAAIFEGKNPAIIEAKIKEDRLIFLDTSKDEDFVYFHIKDNAGGVGEGIIVDISKYFTKIFQIFQE